MNLFEASAAGDEDALRDELERDPESAGARSADGFSPVLFALYNGQAELVGPILEGGRGVAHGRDGRPSFKGELRRGRRRQIRRFSSHGSVVAVATDTRPPAGLGHVREGGHRSDMLYLSHP